MFWFTKNANENKSGKGRIEGSAPQKPADGNQKTKASADIRAQALANAKLAREAIGEEALQKIAAAIQRKQASLTERAKDRIIKTDPERVAEEILSMLEE